MGEESEIIFLDESKEDLYTSSWKILIVDDEEDVHILTRAVLSDFVFLDKGIEFFSAYNEKDALKIMSEEDDIAVVLLDIIMERDDSGLRVAKAIRDDLGNKFVRIIARTGQPGIAPAEKVIVDYDINDYKEKTELTSNKLFATIVTALRGYKDLISLNEKEDILILQSRQAIMGEMLSMIAHQWRQPLNTIAILANTIIISIDLDKVDIEDFKGTAKSIVDKTTFLSQTIDDFREFFAPNKEKDLVVIDDIFDSALSVIEKSLEVNNIEIKKEFDSKSKINIYSRELMQVFLNIMKNSQDASVENKIENAFINVKTEEDDSMLHISICDNAGGIPNDIINKVFDPYFTTKNAKNGTGLGLYISKMIVEKHLNGTLEIQNKENVGVCFKISIPF